MFLESIRFDLCLTHICIFHNPLPHTHPMPSVLHSISPSLHLSVCCRRRVQGVLAVSRAFGDRTLKPFVIADPELKVRKLEPGDDFLILASDGTQNARGVRDMPCSAPLCASVSALLFSWGAARCLNIDSLVLSNFPTDCLFRCMLKSYLPPRSCLLPAPSPAQACGT